MSSNESDALDFLDSDDLISWLMSHSDTNNHANHSQQDIAIDIPAAPSLPPQCDQNQLYMTNSHQEIINNNCNEYGQYIDDYSSNANIPLDMHSAHNHLNHHANHSVTLNDNRTLACKHSMIPGTIDCPPKIEKKRSLSRVSSNGSMGSLTGLSSGGPEVKRKRVLKVDELEARILAVKRENQELQSHLMTVQKRTVELQKQKQAMLSKMKAKFNYLNDISNNGGVNQYADQKELQNLLTEYSAMYADYGEYRKKEIAFHLSQLEHLLLPTQTTKMCLWAMQQDKSFYSTESALFNIFCQEIGITEEQTIKLQERKEKISLLTSQLKETLSLLQKFKLLLEDKHKKFDDTCGSAGKIASPKQVVAFLLWISNNSDKLAQVIPNFLTSEAAASGDHSNCSNNSNANTDIRTSINASINSNINTDNSTIHTNPKPVDADCAKMNNI